MHPPASGNHARGNGCDHGQLPFPDGPGEGGRPPGPDGQGQRGAGSARTAPGQRPGNAPTTIAASDDVLIYNVAKLAESGVHVDILSQLTDWQLINVYNHPRNDKGELVKPVLPPPPPSYEADCIALMQLCQHFHIGQEQREQKLAAIKAKWGKGPQE